MLSPIINTESALRTDSCMSTINRRNDPCFSLPMAYCLKADMNSCEPLLKCPSEP